MIAIKNNVLRLVKTETVKRTTDIGVGQKNIATMRILTELTKTMRDSGNSLDDIKRFQYEFCEENGINIPNIFMEGSVNSIKSFINECLEESDGNISVKEAYEKYVIFCRDKRLQIETKQDFMSYLKYNGMWKSRATANGKKVTNAIRNVKFKEEGEL